MNKQVTVELTNYTSSPTFFKDLDGHQLPRLPRVVFSVEMCPSRFTRIALILWNGNVIQIQEF